MNKVRMRFEQIAIATAALIAALIVLSSLTPIRSPANLLVAAGAGFLGFGFSEILLGLIHGNLDGMASGSELSESRRTGLAARRGPEEQQSRKSWYNTEQHEHHRYLVDWFFRPLKNLRVAHSPREPFHLDLLTMAPPPHGLPVDASLFSLPLREEATYHLAAAEYVAARRAFDSLVDAVVAFNARADKVISATDLEEKIRRLMPDLRNESDPGPLTRENYYYSRKLLLALEKSAGNVDAETRIVPSGTNLGKMMPWLAGYNLVIGGYTVAHVKEERHAEEFQRLTSDLSRELREVTAEREALMSRLEVDLGAFREELRKLEDFQVRQRLFGKCHVEEALEERAGLDRSLS